MTTSQLNTFLTVCRCLSFTEAAASLNLTQSAVSRQISGLESELELRLFDRNNNILHLTPAGEWVRAGFTEVMQSIGTIVSEAQRINSGLQNILRIGHLDDQVISAELGDAIRSLTRGKDVNVTVSRLDPEALYQRLREGTLDMVDIICHSDNPNGGFETLTYQRNHPLYLAMRSELLNELFESEGLPRRITKQWLSQLSRHIPIHLPDPGDIRWPTVRLFTVENFPGATYRDADSIAMMTSIGLCATVVNRDNLIARDPNITLLEMPLSLSVSRCLLWQRDNHNPMVAELVAAIKKQTDKQA